jgi:hypothetical protein
MKDMLITFENAEVLKGFGKIRMETTDGGVLRVKPTNRLKSRDLADLNGNTAIIPMRYFTLVVQRDKPAFEVGQYGLEKNAHGWYTIVQGTGITLSDVITGQAPQGTVEPVETPAVEQPKETFDANIGVGLYPDTNPHYNPAPLAEPTFTLPKKAPRVTSKQLAEVVEKTNRARKPRKQQVTA